MDLYRGAGTGGSGVLALPALVKGGKNAHFVKFLFEKIRPGNILKYTPAVKVK